MPQALRQRTRARQERAARRRRLFLIGAPVVLIVAVAATAVVVVARRPERDDVRAGSVISRGSAVTIARTPASYRIAYRVESRGGPRKVVSADRVTVRRPFERRLENYAGARPRGKPRTVEVVTSDRLFTRSAGGNPAVLARSPGPAPEVRAAAIVDAALEHGLLERRERRVVVGRPCQVYRSAALLSSLPLAPLPAAGGEHADTCVDAAGLVLEELLVARGRVLLRRVAIAVEEDTPAPESLFAVEGRPVPPELGGAAVQPITLDSRPPGQVFWELERAPDGFTHQGRYAVAEAVASGNEKLPGQPPRRLTYVADVYVRGIDVIVVDQGGTSDSSPPFPEPGPTIAKADLGDLGDATMLLTSSEAVIRADRPEAKFVRVRGTVALSDLVDIARSLQARPEGQITPLGT